MQATSEEFFGGLWGPESPPLWGGGEKLPKSLGEGKFSFGMSPSHCIATSTQLANMTPT